MSRDEEIRTLYNLTRSKNVKSDFILESISVPENCQIEQHSMKALFETIRRIYMEWFP